MEWRDDPEVQDSIRNLLTTVQSDLGNLLNALGKHNDGTPPFQFMKVLGMFVWRYVEYLEHNTESDSLDLTLASISNDPTVQNLVGNMMKTQIERGLNIE
mgnify:FL=1